MSFPIDHPGRGLGSGGAADARSRRERRLRILLGAALAVVIAVIVAVVISTTSPGRVHARTPAQTAALFAGVAQRGGELGDPAAPVTLEELGDLQCPYCRLYDEATLGALVRRYVRTGRVRMVFHHLVLLGPDSRRAAALAVAAGRQGRLWQFVDRFYAHQGPERGGYVTDAFLRRVAGEVRGLDAARALAERSSPAVARRLGADAALARRLGIASTPSFLLYPTGSRPRRLANAGLGVASFAGPIEALLRR